MRYLRPAAAFLIFVVVAVLGRAAVSAEKLGPGAKLESLTIGPAEYRDVTIRSVNVRTLVFTHARGMSSIRLRDLSPDWQARFGYDPAADVEVISPKAPRPKVPVPASKSPTAAGRSKLENLLREFGQPAILTPEVDLRPRFFELALRVKDQGRRPSCAIFAIVSALEYQHAEVTGRADKFSEEYLSWATRKITRRAPVAEAGSTEPVAIDSDADEGFALSEVVAALRGYGIPYQSSMPNTFGRGIDTITEPPAAVIAEARNHQRVFVHALPGHDNGTRINNIVHALNAGVPVAVGMAWPSYRVVRAGFISGQAPLENSGHAVTLVGYKSPTGQLADTMFLFKNSWGVDWGQGGYGVVTFAYLEKHLHATVLLEVQPNSAGG